MEAAAVDPTKATNGGNHVGRRQRRAAGGVAATIEALGAGIVGKGHRHQSDESRRNAHGRR